MGVKCPACSGSGHIAVDCPYCRESDWFEHEDLTSGDCVCCSGAGVFEDVCPCCLGSGLVRQHAS